MRRDFSMWTPETPKSIHVDTVKSLMVMNESPQRLGGSALGRWLVAVLVIGFSAAGFAEPFVAAYVHLGRYFDANMDREEREAALRESIAHAKAAGIRIVMPYSSTSSGAATYPSRVIPDHLYGDWDALGFYIDEARKEGLVAYPTVPVLVCGHDEPRGILLEHTDWALRDGEGKPLGFISAGHPEARAWVISALRELVDRYEVPGILLDYLRFPNKPVDLDASSRRRFESAHDNVEITIADRGDSAWQAFKEQQLTVLMSEIRSALPNTTLALYCWGPHVTQGHYVGQNWAGWAHDGLLDVINVSGYCYPDNYGDAYMDAFRRRLSGAKALLDEGGGTATATFCLGVVTSHGRIENASEIGEYLSVAREVGMEGVAVFTLNTLSEYQAEIATEDYFRTFEREVTTGK